MVLSRRRFCWKRCSIPLCMYVCVYIHVYVYISSWRGNESDEFENRDVAVVDSKNEGIFSSFFFFFLLMDNPFMRFMRFLLPLLRQCFWWISRDVSFFFGFMYFTLFIKVCWKFCYFSILIFLFSSKDYEKRFPSFVS